MNRLEQIEKEIEELEDFLSANDDRFIAETNGYEEYSAKIYPYSSKIRKLDREKRMLMVPVVIGPVKQRDHIMSLSEFISCVNSGGFIDYDGHGRYVKDGFQYDIDIYPSDVKHNSIRKDFDTIAWYNK